ncbi:MAG: hypothetical protein ACI9JN_002059, partial [Bacteroidia bacterium]
MTHQRGLLKKECNFDSNLVTMQTSIIRKVGILAFVFLTTLASTTAQTFKISPNGKVTLCAGDTLTIEATAGFAKYSWNTRSTNRIIRVTQSGTYICIAADKSGKSYSDTVRVDLVKPIPPKLSINPTSRIVCKGDSLAIDVVNKFQSYLWSNKTTKPYVVIYPTTSGSISLTVKDSNGCKSETKIQYTVTTCGSSTGCDSLIGRTKDTVLCGSKDSLVLEGKSGFVSYLWNDGDKNRVKSIKSAGTYTLKAKDKAGNMCYDTIVIYGKTLKLSITTKSKEICKGDTIELEANKGFTRYVWSTGSRDRSVRIHPDTTTGYLVFAVDRFGCEYIEDIKITVKSCGDCDNLLGASKKALCSGKDSVILEGRSGFKTYKWSTGSNDRVIKVTKKGWYTLTTTTKSGKECKDSIYIGEGGKALKAYSNPNPAIVCPGDKVVIEVTAGFKSYWWNTGHRYDRVELYLKESKTVVIEAVDSNGCESRVEIKVVVKDTCDKDKCPKIIEYWPKKTLCGDKDSISLEAKTGYKDYVWSTREKGRAIWVKTKGWYYLDFKDSSGNTCRDSIYISSGSSKKLKIEITPGKPYCIGDTVFAKATSGFKTYGWNTGSKDRIIEVVLNERKKLVVEAVDSNGCEARAQIVIEPDSCNSSVANLTAIYVSITPNPVQNYVHISSDVIIKLVQLMS